LTDDTKPLAFTRRDVNLALLATAVALAACGMPRPRLMEAETLFDFAIAGGFYHELERQLPKLKPGLALVLRREKANPHDANAVAVHMPDGAKLGFIPRKANEPVAMLLDRGRRVEATIMRLLVLKAERDIPDDLVFTTIASGDPQIRLTLWA
jgi:hypothetical protein